MDPSRLPRTRTPPRPPLTRDPNRTGSALVIIVVVVTVGALCGSVADTVGASTIEAIGATGTDPGSLSGPTGPSVPPGPFRSWGAPDAAPVDPAQTDTETTRTDRGYIVQASDAGSLRVVTGPSRAPLGEWIECGYFEIPVLGAAPGLLSVPLDPRPGLPYFVRCWHRPAGDPVDGYPVIALFDPADPVPGLIDPVDVAEFAVSQLDLEPPAVELSPPARQLVGVDTWLAVTSTLDYPDVTAQAGLAWATVRTRFRDAVWDMGDGSVVVCTDDVATTWSPAPAGGGTDRSSSCSHTYVEVAPAPGHAASVAVTWDLLWINNEVPSPFVPWTELILSTTVPVEVQQLQAVIR